MTQYAVVIEAAGDNFSAYVPDLPGCVATGKSIARVELEIDRAIALHVQGLLEDGLPLPAATPRLSSQRKLGPKHPQRKW